MASRYSVEVRDSYGRLVAVLLRPQNKQFSVYRNRPGSCQFTLDLFDPQATPEILAINQNDIVFRRDGTPVFAGQISYVHPRIDGDTKIVEVIATGYFDLFDQRFVTEDFPGYDALHNQLPFAATDVGQIAWSLLDYTQFPTTSDGSILMTGSGVTLNQSFVAPGTANVSTLKFLMQNVSATGNLVVQLYTDYNGAPSSTLVPDSQLTVAVSGVSATMGWFEIDYSTKPALNEGATYWIRAFLDTVQATGQGVEWGYLNNSYYLDGRAYSPENPALFAADQDLQFFVQLDDNSYQMTKNTYLGIQQGNIATSFDLTPSFAQYKKIKDCVEDLSNTHNGIDFAINISIDPITNYMTKQFAAYYPRQGVDNTALNFTYPGNIKKLERPKDGKTMVNHVAMRGQGYGTVQLVETVDDAASIQAYGLRQDVENQADVDDSGTLISLGSELIRVRKDPLDLPNVVLDGNVPPHIGDYGIGDQITLDINEAPLVDFTSVYRIERVDATISDDDMEEINLTVSIA